MLVNLLIKDLGVGVFIEQNSVSFSMHAGHDVVMYHKVIICFFLNIFHNLSSHFDAS